MSDFPVTVFHNPACGTSRNTLAMIRASGEEPVVIEYLKNPPTREKLESAAGRLLGYGIGMIYTPLHESTFSAVAVPGTTTKVIAETKRETRAGDATGRGAVKDSGFALAGLMAVAAVCIVGSRALVCPPMRGKRVVDDMRTRGPLVARRPRYITGDPARPHPESGGCQ